MKNCCTWRSSCPASGARLVSPKPFNDCRNQLPHQRPLCFAAPLVGRTAPQCLDRYEKLLDEAQGKDLMDAADDPRRLRPGEVDPQPEIKPARPDPIDMDEDELDMLNEARARLANTRGKKAKRKARERQLEEARRMAALQKHRELRAAGLAGTRQRRRRQKDGFDYSVDIPFEKETPAGFFDTAEEDAQYEKQKVQRDFNAVSMQRLEQANKAKEAAALKARDARRAAQLEATNLPRAVAEAAARADSSTLATRKRAALVLPAPTVTDSELRDIVDAGKMTAKAAAAASSGLGAGHGATAGLVSDLGAGAGGMTPAMMQAMASSSTRTPAQNNAVMESARQLAQLTAVQTPLLAGDAAAAGELDGGQEDDGVDDSASQTGHDEDGDSVIPGGRGTGFAGAKPDIQRLSTPNPLALAAAAARSTLGRSSSSGASVVGGSAASAIAAGTPLSAMLPPPRSRGGLGGLAMSLPPPRSSAASTASSVAGDDAASVASGVTGVTTSTMGGGAGRRSMDLRAALAALPAPENEVDVLLPDAEELAAARRKHAQAANHGTSSQVEDAEVADARAAAAAAAKAAEDALLRSSALQQNPPLPRPWTVDEGVIAPPLGASPSAEQLAAGLIMDEVATRMLADAVEEPPVAPRGIKVRVPRSKPVELVFSGEELMLAKRMIEAEAGDPPAGHSEGEWPDASEYVYLPSQRVFKLKSECSDAEVCAASEFEVDCLQRLAGAEGKRLSKLANKLGVLLGGYQRRSTEACTTQHSAAAALAETAHKLRSYMHLASSEGSAAQARLAVSAAEAREAKEAEASLQQQYAQLQREAEGLEKVLAQAV